MTHSFSQNSLSITTSLNERTIYIKITDTTSYHSYESNISLTEMKLNVDIADAYQLILNCFDPKEENCNYSISICSGVMKICFKAVIGGYFNVIIEIALKEKLMSNDAQLSLNFNQLEQTHNKNIKKLENDIDKLTQTIIKMADKMDMICDGALIKLINSDINGLYPIGTIELNVRLDNRHVILYCNIKLFINIKKLILHDISNRSFADLTAISSKSLVELVLNQVDQTFQSLKGIENFPSLEKLSIAGSGLNTCSIKLGLNDILQQSLGKLRVLTLINVIGSSEPELIEYCNKHNITLSVS